MSIFARAILKCTKVALLFGKLDCFYDHRFQGICKGEFRNGESYIMPPVAMCSLWLIYIGKLMLETGGKVYILRGI